jgi:hypothetical protein
MKMQRKFLGFGMFLRRDKFSLSCEEIIKIERVMVNMEIPFQKEGKGKLKNNMVLIIFLQKAQDRFQAGEEQI